LSFLQGRQPNDPTVKTLDYRKTYLDLVRGLEGQLERDEALSTAVGGEYSAVGKLEHFLLRSLGLADGHLVVDVGCGSGRLATQLAPHRGIRYLGCDVVDALICQASRVTRRGDWTFVCTDGSRIPSPAGVADFVCFFSVFTHIVHEDIFRYFNDAHRVLQPGGLLVFSFLEFRIGSHWTPFAQSLESGSFGRPLTQFIDRDAIRAWAGHVGFDVIQLFDGDKPHIPLPEEVCWENGDRMRTLGNLGQSVAVLQKPTLPAT
jgi:SAM-dependent methyltransferase